MRPEDQDELRRQAQRVLSRRISADPESSVHTPEPAAGSRPQQLETQPRRRAERQGQRTPRERPRLRPRADADGRRVVQRVEVPDTRVADEARARAARRLAADDTPSSVQRRPAHSPTSNASRSQLRSMLMDRDQLKRAILLSEILGKPVSLRNREESGYRG
jgi:hypothetical protein